MCPVREAVNITRLLPQYCSSTHEIKEVKYYRPPTDLLIRMLEASEHNPSFTSILLVFPRNKRSEVLSSAHRPAHPHA